MYNGIFLLMFSFMLLSCEDNGSPTSRTSDGNGNGNGDSQDNKVIVSCVCKGQQHTALILGKGKTEDVATEDAKSKCKSIASTFSASNCKKR